MSDTIIKVVDTENLIKIVSSENDIYKLSETLNNLVMNGNSSEETIKTIGECLNDLNTCLTTLKSNLVSMAITLNGKEEFIDLINKVLSITGPALDVTSTANTTLTGYHFVDSTYKKVEGLIPVLGELTLKSSTITQEINGYTSKLTIPAETDLISDNIISGKTICGVSGSIEDLGDQNVTISTTDQVIGPGKVKVTVKGESGLLAGNIKKDVVIGNVTGTLSGQGSKVAGIACINVGSAQVRGSRPMTQDVDYIYAVTGNDAGPLIKINKNTLSEVARSTVNYGGTIEDMVCDDTYLYIGGTTGKVISRYLKSDLSFVDSSPSYGGDIYALYVDDNYVYAVGTTTMSLARYNKQTLVYIDSAGTFGGYYSYFNIFGDANYIFIIGNSMLRKINKSTFTVDGYVSISGYFGCRGFVYNNKIYVNTQDSLFKVLNYDTLSIEYTCPSNGNGSSTKKDLWVADNIIYSLGEYLYSISLDDLNTINKGNEYDYVGEMLFDDNYCYTEDGSHSYITKNLYKLYLGG